MISIVAAFALTAGLVAHATDGRLVAGPPDAEFASVSIDSRTIRPGALFVAIKGERFDGHAYLGQARQRGAAGVLVSERPAGAYGLPTVLVSDTVAALQALGREVRRRSGATVIAITGSAGKTTTKEITADLLGARYRVFRNRGNLNNHIGLPLSLTELTAAPEMAVVEFGMNHPGEIRALVSMAEPDVRVWTNVGDAHLGFFGSRDAVARAKAEILERATPATIIVANADDPLVMGHVAGTAGRLVTFGTREGATVRAIRIVDRGFDGTIADVATPAGLLHLTVPLPGRAQLMNVLAAVATAMQFEVPAAAIVGRVAALQPVARRGASVTLASGVRLIDDSYNASPAAVRVMLDALAVTEVRGRRIAILGEMLELGEAAYALHEACGRAAADAGVDVLVAVGGAAADGLAAGAAAAGMTTDRVYRYADSPSACAPVRSLLASGDVVLIKGSRGSRMDVIVDDLQREGQAG